MLVRIDNVSRYTIRDNIAIALNLLGRPNSKCYFYTQNFCANFIFFIW